jgi:hypothetical protein
MPGSDASDTPTASFKVKLTGNGFNVDTTTDAHTAREIMSLLLGGSSSAASSPQPGSTRKPARKQRKGAAANATAGTKTSSKRRSGSPSIVRDLSMHPKGKKSFADFAAEKRPKSHSEKQTVAVAWLRSEGGMDSGITVDHVNTCYVDAKWPRPAMFENALQTTASRKGWLDTSDMNDIKLTIPGEDEVEHKLPSPVKSK